MLKEYNLSVNDFNEPLVDEGAKAVCTLLARLILLEPGTIQSHPDMGVGIISKFRFSFTGRAAELKGLIESQINKYLPSLSGVQINVQEANKVYYITAQMDKQLYGISIDSNMNTQTAYKTLTELS